MHVGKTFTFDAAHRLENHDGKCRNLHGHTYRVDVSVRGFMHNDGPSAGMVIDFGELKTWWHPLDAILDHATLLQEDDPLVELLGEVQPAIRVTTFKYPPTAEHLAEFINNDLHNWIETHHPDLLVGSVRVYETPTSWAEG